MSGLRLIFYILLAGTGLSLGAVTVVSAQPSATGPHIEVELVSEHQQLTKGTNWLALFLQPEQDWHTYWRNPGDSGEAPVLNWTLPEGITAGDVNWPLPKIINVAHLVNYGYEGANLLMVPIEVSQQVYKAGQHVSVTLDASWLVCKEDCIPGWASLTLTLPMADTTTPSAMADRFEATRKQLPQTGGISARHEITDSHILVSLSSTEQSRWQLLPFDSGVIQHNQPQQLLENGDDTTLVLPRSDYYVPSDTPLQFLLTDGDKGFYLSSQYNAIPPPRTDNLALLMLMALAGGIILNLMPCVLPVLSIKALSLSAKRSDSRSIGTAYTLGVIASFNVFAGVILFLKHGGEAVGWGFHMQAPWVVAGLAYLFVLIGLAMLDLVPLTNRLSGAGQNWIKEEGLLSQFLTGVLAVLVASPCTAPFMAAALGVAMVSDAVTSIAIFNALALGFALPMALLSWSPALQKWLPRPGNWMVTFRQFLAFPMFATVIWLLWVYVNQTNSLSQALLLTGLLLFSLFVWLLSKTEAKASKGILALCLIASVVLPVTSQQSQPRQRENAENSQAYSLERLSALKADEQVVLVNMTADWCITCKVNEQVAFQSPEVRGMLARENVHYLVGDWTNKNTVILNYLNQYQRAGVPLYVVYAGTQSEQVLPQILTPDTVVDALQTALGETQR